MKKLSKSQFKPKALAIMRKVEEEGKSILITDHGRPVLELRPYTAVDDDPLNRLKGSVSEFLSACDPVAETDWEGAN